MRVGFDTFDDHGKEKGLIIFTEVDVAGGTQYISEELTSFERDPEKNYEMVYVTMKLVERRKVCDCYKKTGDRKYGGFNWRQYCSECLKWFNLHAEFFNKDALKIS